MLPQVRTGFVDQSVRGAIRGVL